MKRVLFLFVVLFSFCCHSQDNPSWRSYFSYNNIVDISQSNNRIYAAAESAVFSKSLLTNELKTTTSVDGLKAETITAVHHSGAYNKTLVGNSNGLLLIINADNTVVNKVDIVEETTIQSNKKKINHIYEFEGKAYISCDFGIAVFNIATMEFGDTYYLGPNGAEIAVVQTTVLDNIIYAATTSNGIRKALINNPNLNDFNQWTEEQPGNWAGVLAYNGNLYASSLGGVLFKKIAYYQVITIMPSVIVHLQESNGYMVLSSKERVTVLDNQLAQVVQINTIPEAIGPVTFTCASVVNGQLFIGTREEGVFSTNLNNIGRFSNITPDGPLRSGIFSLEKSPNFLWAVYGDYNYSYNPSLSQYGISKLTATGWLNISNEDLFGAASISDIIVSPTNENLVYAASFHNGLIKIENDVPTAQYDDNPVIQNGPQSVIPQPPTPATYRSVRINGLAYDRQNNLWMTNSQIIKPIKVMKADGTWASYTVENITNEPLRDSYGKMVIDKNGTKWIPTLNNGLIGFNEKYNDKYILLKNDSNLPSTYVRCVAIDNRNQLWIGTSSGLRVLPGVDRFLTETELTTNDIIILENGVPRELLDDQFITKIKVDGSNNKWIGTAAAGAFLVSPDGQQTLFHFTKDNSPLPSNQINDIEIDAATGEVFFATDKGMVSYAGTSTKAADDLSNVYVFPNPVRPGFEGDVNISGLIDKANIKITDIEGNLVYETTSEGGTILWNTTAFGRYKVASGVYMIFVASEDGTQTTVKKVMVVR